MKKRCVLLIGLQASGKTTFCRRFFPGLVPISLDSLHTRKKERALLEKCLESGDSFVVDNTNPTREDRERYIIPAAKAGYRIIGFYFQSSVSGCMERNSRRSGKARVPEAAIAATHRKLELPDREEGFDELFYVRIGQDCFEVEPWREEDGREAPLNEIRRV